MLDTSDACNLSSAAMDPLGLPRDSAATTGQSAFPAFDFYALPLSVTARHQLSHIYKTRRCRHLADLIRRHAFDPERGYYIPVSKDGRLS